MTKHLADHQSAPAMARKKHFWAIEQRGAAETPHPAIRTLNQRPKNQKDGTRVQQFLRIDRGVTA
jgi:hypothetical protein